MPSASSSANVCIRGTLPGSCGLKRRTLTLQLTGLGSDIVHRAILHHLIDTFVFATKTLGQKIFIRHQSRLKGEAIDAIERIL